MRNISWKRLAAGAVAACLLVTLTACGGGITEKDAEVYVKGHLDAAYLGTHTKEYIDLVEDMTEDDIDEMHQNNITWEAEILLEDFFQVEYPTDEMTQRAKELIEKIYSKSKYTVGTGSKTKDGDFVVEVTVSPIEVLNLITDEDLFDALEQSGYAEAVTDEEVEAADAVYGMLALDLLEQALPQLTYGEDQIIMLQLKPDDDGYYTLVETGIQKVDEVMIDYNGYYAD
ncbi:MAG: hypothetical protein HFF57_02300 [Lawsonibacter sp.]|jgi:hypothetical protein|nr:hypothetical protein [Lawsonibacter sp.]